MDATGTRDFIIAQSWMNMIEGGSRRLIPASFSVSVQSPSHHASFPSLPQVFFNFLAVILCIAGSQKGVLIAYSVRYASKKRLKLLPRHNATNTHTTHITTT